MTSWPAYLALHDSGELQKRAESLKAMFADCELCPHECKVDRWAGEEGFCRAPSQAMFSASYPHRGNEDVISGTRGSGNIFFTCCNSRCVFCQNSDISQDHRGTTVSDEELARMYLKLQNQNCHNVDFVTPAHFLPNIVNALNLAVEGGLKLPLVYNTNGYERLEVLELLDGIIDIYLPDFKFSDEQTGRRLTGMKNYPEVCRTAIEEMYRQVGLLELDEQGIARKGLIVRHLVMPDNAGGTAGVLDAVAGIDKEITVNLMAQYHPAYKAINMENINRRINRIEYQAAIEHAQKIGLKNVWAQNVPLTAGW